MIRPPFDRTEHATGIAQLDCLDCKKIWKRWHNQGYWSKRWVIHKIHILFRTVWHCVNNRFDNPEIMLPQEEFVSWINLLN